MSSLFDWINKTSPTQQALIRWLVLPLLFLMLITSLAGTWVYFTESGLKWSLRQLESFIPAQLTLNSPSGSLSSNVRFESVSWQQQNIGVEAKQLTLKCRWLALLSKEVVCTENRVKQLAISMNESETSSSTEKSNFTDYLSQPLAELISPRFFSELKLPVNITLNTLDIALIKIETINSDTSNELKQAKPSTQNSSKQPPTSISNFSLSGFKLKQLEPDESSLNALKLSFSKMLLTFKRHQLSSQFNISSEGNWPYQLKFAVVGDKVNSTMDSQGELFASSNYNLKTQRPVNSAQNGQWNWNKHLFINSAAKIEPQKLTFIEKLSNINSAEIKLNLSWPQTNLNYQSNFDWLGFQGLNLNGVITTSDIINWRVSSEVTASLQGEIKPSQWLSLKQKAAKITDEELVSAQSLVTKLEQAKPDDNAITTSKKISKQPLPINLKLFAEIAQSNLNIRTENFSFAELSGSFDLTGKLVEFSLPNYSIDAKVMADHFNFADHYFSGVNAALALKSHNNRISIDSKGVIAEFQNKSISSNNLKWNFKLAEKWIGQLNLKNIAIDELNLRDINFKLNGNQQQHSINGSLTPVDYQPISFNLKGKLNTDRVSSKSSWNIGRLTAKTELSQINLDELPTQPKQKDQSFNFEATNLFLTADKQTVEKLCLQDFGKACLKASIDKNNWSAQLELDKFKLRPLTRLPILQSLSGLTGELNGKLQAAGNLQTTFNSGKLNTLIIDVTSPELAYAKSQAQINLAEFSISNTNPNGTSILSEWKQLTGRYSTPQWITEIAAKNGQAKLELHQTGESSFSASQQSAQWILPFTGGEESEQDKVTITKKSLLINNININGRITASQLVGDLKVALAEDDYIQASNQISWPITNDSKIDSTIQLKISQLDWLKQWQSRIDQLAGNWTHQLEITGTPSKPKINGKGEISLSKLEMEELGIDIKDSSITLLSDDYTTNLSGLLKNNQGELKIDGSATISPELTASLNLNGEKITLIDSKEYKMVVSPKLNASIRKSHLDITGDIDINEAKISISQLPAKTVRVSEDEVIVNKKRTNEEPFTYDIRVNVNAKNNVKVKGFGLTSEVLGKLSANAQTGKNLDINGQLYLENGQFEAYKQVLTIEQGQLLFLGNPENPGIQFKASRKIEESVVGVIASGSLAKPNLRLYSEPAMADEEILALLLTRRSLDSLTQQEGNALANAAISLGVSEANRLAAKIADTLGIKNINITTKTKADSTRVDIGTQVNDRLSVGFGTNIDSTNQLNSGWIIEYRLSPNISFEAISGEEVSANITYKKQFDDKKGNKDQNKD